MAGRIIELSLYPLSAKEKSLKSQECISEKLFKRDFRTKKEDYYNRLIEYIIDGGYPEILKLKTPMEKSLWFSSYISTYIERDARDLAEIRDTDSFIKFVNVISTRSGTILNKSSLSADIAVTDRTVENYLGILQRVYQGFLLKPYFENIGKQFVKSPKFFLGDSGILSYFLKIKNREELLKSHYCGAIFETFVFTELQKDIAYADNTVEMYHYRTSDKKKIDFILISGQQIVAIEVKSSSTIQKSDFKHIIDFQSRSKKDVIGIIFYTGDHTVEISENLAAIPMSFLI